MKGPPNFTWTDTRNQGEGMRHRIPDDAVFHDTEADAGPASGRMRNGVTPTFDITQPPDGPARGGSADTVGSSSEAIATVFDPRAGTGDVGDLRRSGRRRVPPDYLNY